MIREEWVGRVGQRRQVVIPREMLESLKIRAGDLVAFRKHADGVLVQPRRVVDGDDVLTPAEAKRVRHGMAQIKRGRYKIWRDVKDALDR